MTAEPVLHCGDCLEILGSLPAESVDLAYLDPPYATGRSHGDAKLRFDDRWPSLAAYLDFLRERLAAVHRVLRPTGSILLHVDWRTVHHARLILDEVFGPERFVNHLIWSYGLGGSSPRRFARKHDDILFYGKTDDDALLALPTLTGMVPGTGGTGRARPALRSPSWECGARGTTGRGQGSTTTRPRVVADSRLSLACLSPQASD